MQSIDSKTHAGICYDSGVSYAHVAGYVDADRFLEVCNAVASLTTENIIKE